MGKKGGWFSAVRKALGTSYDYKEKKDKKPQKTASKKSWFGKQKNVESDSTQPDTAFATPAITSPTEPVEELKYTESEQEPSKPTQPETEPGNSTDPENEPSKTTILENESSKPENESSKPENEPCKPTKPENEPSKPTKPENEPIKPTKPENEQRKPTKTENELSKPAYSMAYARAAVAAATFRRFLGKSKEEVAAIKVQTAFRRFLARRKLRSLKGLVRLKVLVQNQSVKRQAITTLRCMQTLARVQSQVRARRIRMSEENQALQRQLLQKREKELESMRSSLGTEWVNSRRTKEQLEASIQNKQEAAARRERALAYAQTQQQMWRNPSKSANPTFMDPNNPHWGWSWLDRWMAARPWESQSPIDDEQPPTKGLTRSSSVGDMSKRLDRSPSMSSPRSPSVSSRRLAPSSPKATNDSMQSPRNRRHSIASSSFREDSSVSVSSPRVSSPRVSSPRVSSPRVSSPRVSSPRVSSPRSAKTKSMIPSPSPSPSPSRSPSPSPLGSAKKGSLEKKPTTASAKRRLSLSGAPSAGSSRRLSMSSNVGSGFR